MLVMMGRHTQHSKQPESQKRRDRHIGHHLPRIVSGHHSCCCPFELYLEIWLSHLVCVMTVAVLFLVQLDLLRIGKGDYARLFVYLIILQGEFLNLEVSKQRIIPRVMFYYASSKSQKCKEMICPKCNKSCQSAMLTLLSVRNLRLTEIEWHNTKFTRQPPARSTWAPDLSP